MKIQLLFENRRSISRGPGRFWRWSRSLFLLIAIIALGYSGWMYFDAYRHEREESDAFDRARKGPAREASPPAEWVTAKLEIPRLGLSAMVDEGVGENTLRRSAGHIPHTGLPGRPGNVGVAAHRDTLFRSLQGIKKHDRIVLSTLKSDYNYEVISTSIVNPEDVRVLDPSRGLKTLTLVTCYPFEFIGHAPKRFIVRAQQIDENSRSTGTTLARRNARHAAPQADAETHKIQPEISADAARRRVDAERAIPERAILSEAPAAGGQPQPEQAAKTALRMRLLRQLDGWLATRDTPRGLVATVGDVDFSGPVLRGMAVNRVARIAAIVAAYPELRVRVDGHADCTVAEAVSRRRAEDVRSVLVGNGLPADAVAARGFGNTRLLASNASATGRRENRRVEIVISGDPIGALPTWDRTYTLAQR